MAEAGLGGEVMAQRPRRVLVCACGSVAAIRVPRVVRELEARGCEIAAQVEVVLTESAVHFVEIEESIPRGVRVWRDEDEWKGWRKLGDPVVHIELRRWADVLLFAPLSANTLAKLALGLSDNLATSVARAWDLAAKPLFLAPAMNTHMWEHPLTRQHLQSVAALGMRMVDPVSKTLACGDVGIGAMAAPADIAAAVARFGRDESD
mmetsp:Transcript_13719/g.36833  ORF Transcript_13719/g.36833 Transcript_13719/m.36833 type:complete len:206 (+) Transcript_13719:13-630(+)